MGWKVHLAHNSEYPSYVDQIRRSAENGQVSAKKIIRSLPFGMFSGVLYKMRLRKNYQASMILG